MRVLLGSPVWNRAGKWAGPKWGSVRADKASMCNQNGVKAGFEALEPRVMMSAAAAASITLADRAELAANLAPGSLATTLKYRLKAGDAAGVDQILLGWVGGGGGGGGFFLPEG